MNLPAINTATLPETYENACTALAECTRIDECKEWADKSMAMASYAKQSKDESLMNMAIKIKARAIRRCGELLKLVESAQGKNSGEKGGDSPFYSKKQAIADAGMSLDQGKQALNVANIPEDKFNHMVDDEHATISALAKAGRKVLTEKKPAGYKQATQAIGFLRRMAVGADEHDVNIFKGGMSEKEMQEMKERAIFMIAWLNDLLTDLENEDV